MKNLLLVCFLAAIAIGSVAAEPALVLQLDKSSNNAHSIVFTLTALEELNVLPWGTPLEDRLRAPIFHLEDAEGNTCQWEGALFHRKVPAIPEPDHLISLTEGFSISVEYDLSQLFNCHDNPSGLYHVSLRFPMYAFLDASGELVDLEIRDDGISVQWDASFVDVPKILGPSFMERPAETVSAMANTYTNCNSGEQSNVAAAVPAAQKQAANGWSCMNKGMGNCPLAVTWFGASTSTNWNYDLGTLNNIKNRLANGMAAYCNPSGCAQGVYAYVYPTQCCTVYLCSVFWSIPSERAETIVHEESHFNANSITSRGTQDYAYGRNNCKNLAKSNPTQASNNADNVCYFAAGYS